MLFAYRYISHRMEKLQTFIDYIFYDVWCSAPHKLLFDLSLFENSPELKEIVEGLIYEEEIKLKKDALIQSIEDIFYLFCKLQSQQIEQLKKWYHANNQIEQACADSSMELARYTDLSTLDSTLAKQLNIFFKNLYEHNTLKKKIVQGKVGTIREHYKKFVKENAAGVCPFCGLSRLKGESQSKREAYDHYLPKSVYPFNSINFHNLAPACHECNSDYKRTKDPLRSPNGRRRKAFYPYAENHVPVSVRIDIHCNDYTSIDKNNIEIVLQHISSEELATWKEMYGIEDRYKDRCCSNSDGKAWLVQILDEWSYDGRSPESFLRTLARQTNENATADCRFLKKAFLEGCEKAGFFTDIQRSGI